MIEIKNIEDLSSDKFLKVSKFLSINQIIDIFEKKQDNLEDYYNIEIDKFTSVFNASSDYLKDKLSKVINDIYLMELIKNNSICNKNIWENTNVEDDLDNFLYKLNTFGLLNNVILSIDNIRLKSIFNNVSFYNLSLVFSIIKNNPEKFKIFINSIQPSYLDLLISKMNSFDINFVSNNINYIIKLEQIGRLFVLNANEINNLNLTKLQIVMLLNSYHENIIINSILLYEIEFIKNIITELKIENFRELFFKVRGDQLHEIIDFLPFDKILYVIDNNSSPFIVNRILKNINIFEYTDLIHKLSLQQIISSVYDLEDNIIIFISKNLSSEHNANLIDLYNRIHINDLGNVLPLFTKQLLCYLFTIYSIKHAVITNFNNLKNDQILIILNLMNGDDIYKALKVCEFNKRNFILSNLNIDQSNMLNNVIDRKLDNLDINANNNLRDIILIKNISLFIKLILLPHNDIKLKNIM